MFNVLCIQNLITGWLSTNKCDSYLIRLDTRLIFLPGVWWVLLIRRFIRLYNRYNRHNSIRLIHFQPKHNVWRKNRMKKKIEIYVEVNYYWVVFQKYRNKSKKKTVINEQFLLWLLCHGFGCRDIVKYTTMQNVVEKNNVNAKI